MFDRVVVSDVDFSRSRFLVFNSVGCRFENCDFSRTRFDLSGGFSLDPPSTFRSCVFDGAHLRAMWALGATRCERCTFIGARIESWQSDCAEFVACIFGGRIVRSRFSGRPQGLCAATVGRTFNEFRANDFSRADLVDSSFTNGIDLSAQLWPSDPVYTRFDRPAERVRSAQADVSRWAVGADRDHALRLLEIIALEARGQAEIIIRRDTFRSLPKRVVDDVWDRLEAG
jgi:hypothetical protein